MNVEIFKIVIGQLVRHFISIGAAALGTYGVTEAQQGELTEAIVYIAIAIVVFLVGQGWAYVSKRLALMADPPEEE